MADAQRLLRAYLIVGENTLKREQALARLKRYVQGDFCDFNLDERAKAQDIAAQDLIASLNTMPFGGDLRLVIVHEAEKLPKDVSEAIISYLANPNPTTTLCLVSEKLAKNTRLYKAVAGVGGNAVVACDPLKRKDLPQHVRQLASKGHGITIDFDAANELVNRAGEDVQMLDSQLRTLSEMLGRGHNVTKAEVERYVARTAEVKPWEFLDAVCEKNARKAFSLLAIMGDKRYVALLSLLVGRIREVICAKSLAARGEQGSIAKTLGKQPWLEQRYVDWAWRFAPGELERALMSCAACERVLKGAGDDEEAFTKLVLSICG